MNRRFWRPGALLVPGYGMLWLAGTSILAPGIIETARGGQWGRFAFYFLCAALITGAFMLMLLYVVRQHARGSQQRYQ